MNNAFSNKNAYDRITFRDTLHIISSGKYVIDCGDIWHKCDAQMTRDVKKTGHIQLISKYMYVTIFFTLSKIIQCDETKAMPSVQISE